MKKIYLRVFALMLAFALFVSPVYAVNVVNPGNGQALPDAATVTNAVNEFKSLSRKEKRERMKEVKKLLKEHKQQKKAGAAPSENTILLAILAILLPPLAVYLHEGEANNRFWISVLLTLLFWIPGVIYALFVVLS